ncbi:hypothetical protein K8R04_03655 [Candidatus Uhrbacteria bacterium]|nr:hypothetical protein [Candidatus Uhrbacteria bacterium]
MTPDGLIRSLLGDRRAREYVLSLPPGEFEEHLEALEIKSFVVTDDNPELYRLAGMGFYPVVYLEHRVAFESDVPREDVLKSLDYLRRQEVQIPPPRTVVSYLNEEQFRMLSMHIRIMCLARSEPEVKRIAPKRARVVYDCRIGEHWVEIYFSTKAIPAAERMSA